MKVKAEIVPDRKSGIITAGKEYQAKNYDTNGIASFEIVSDDGFDLFCLVQGCAHLDGSSWIIVEE